MAEAPHQGTNPRRKSMPVPRKETSAALQRPPFLWDTDCSRHSSAVPPAALQGCWRTQQAVESVKLVQSQFKPRLDLDDVLLVTYPKCGTTWLKALAFAVADRSRLLVRSLYRYGPKAVTGLLPRPGRGRPTNSWLVGPRCAVL
jgi:hypothetical protein